MGALDSLRALAWAELSSIKTKDELVLFKSRFLGKNGKLRQILASLGEMEIKDRISLGQGANKLKEELEEKIVQKQIDLANINKETKLKETIDITEPGLSFAKGFNHPLSIIAGEIFDCLGRLGFEKAVGPQIEHDFYNFEALNIPKDHPARDMQDTFYIEKNIMLRTHTSPVQIRAMLAKKVPPLKIMSFGRVFRKDEDVTHSPMFHQIEGLYVDEKVSLSDLKGTLETFVTSIFGKDASIRLRPSFFPFTEPSIEVDVSCFLCKIDSTCKICKGSGWIEILGAGMVDPEVFHACKYDSERYSGFAFGLGIERIAMLKFGISDIRLFFENDLRFLQQF